MGLLAENRVEFLDAFWAAGKIRHHPGAAVHARRPPELAQIVRDSGMRCLMHSARFDAVVSGLRELVQVERYLRPILFT